MMPTVRGVIVASIWAGSIVNVTGSTSQNTTRPPAWVIIADVETHECAVVMTSSPGFTPSARMAIWSASVPLAQETQCFTPRAAAQACSKASTCGPRMKAESAITLRIASSISSRIDRYCALRSTKGTFMRWSGLRSGVQATQQTRRVAGVNARPNEGVVADRTAVKVDGLHDADVLAEVRVDDAGGEKPGLGHCARPSPTRPECP